MRPIAFRSAARDKTGDAVERISLAHADGHDFVGALGFNLAYEFLWKVQSRAPTEPHFRPDPPNLKRTENFGDYASIVAKASEQISLRRLDKVVLARLQRLTFEGQINPSEVFANFSANDPSCYGFMIPTENGFFIGASPELVLSREDRDIVSVPLAGSARRATNLTEDQRNAADLMASTKDLREHRLVVEWVSDVLSPFCSHFDVPEQPVLVKTQTMWHLASPISGTLRSSEASSLELGMRLHPTPAICGTPQSSAQQLIEQLESEPRGLYGGLVGWQNERGDGEWALSIRCAEVNGNTATIWAGAGIVIGSDPSLELAETEAKFGSARRALGVQH